MLLRILKQKLSRLTTLSLVGLTSISVFIVLTKSGLSSAITFSIASLFTGLCYFVLVYTERVISSIPKSITEPHYRKLIDSSIQIAEQNLTEEEDKIKVMYGFSNPNETLLFWHHLVRTNELSRMGFSLNSEKPKKGIVLIKVELVSKNDEQKVVEFFVPFFEQEEFSGYIKGRFRSSQPDLKQAAYWANALSEIITRASLDQIAVASSIHDVLPRAYGLFLEGLSFAIADLLSFIENLLTSLNSLLAEFSLSVFGGAAEEPNSVRVTELVVDEKATKEKLLLISKSLQDDERMLLSGILKV